MIFREASAADIPAIMALYRKQIGTPGCTWDEEYPALENLAGDIRFHAAFVLEDEGRILAAASGGFPPELSDLGIRWRPLQKPCEWARICSAEHGRGWACLLLQRLMQEMRVRGYDGFRLLVSAENPAAAALYRKLGFRPCDETDLYGQHWLCYQSKE